MIRGSSAENYEHLIADLYKSIEARLQAEQRAKEAFPDGYGNQDSRLEQQIQQLAEAFEQQQQRVRDRHDERQTEIAAEFDARKNAAQTEYTNTLNRIEREFSDEAAEAEQHLGDSEWILNSVLDDVSDAKSLRKFETFRNQVLHLREQQEKSWDELQAAYNQTLDLLAKRRQGTEVDPPDSPETSHDREELQGWFNQAYDAAKEAMLAIKRHKLARLFVGFRPLLIFLAVCALVVPVLYSSLEPSMFELSVSPNEPVWFLILLGAAVPVFAIVYTILSTMASRRSALALDALTQQMVRAQSAHNQWVTLAKQELARKQKESQQADAAISHQRQHSMQAIEQKHTTQATQSAQRKHEALSAARQKYPPLLDEIASQRQTTLETARCDFEQTLQETAARQNAQHTQLRDNHEQHIDDQTRQYLEVFKELSAAWRFGVEQLQSSSDELNALSDQGFAPWDQLADPQWTVPEVIPAGVRIGQYQVDLANFEHGISDDPQLQPERSSFSLPAVLPFPEQPSLLLKASGAGRDAAVPTLQVAMLRLLTLIPPGKLRFTIIDPSGLGENFSAFMHLADYDELLVTNRIWTETPHIEQQLVNLTEHMENVFQKYLRNEFRTIEEYNEQAGEVAEPYHILVVANFPHNFNENAARRLASIAGSGARCGIYTLINVDTKHQLPHGFDLAELEQNTNIFRWKDGRYVAATGELTQLPLTLDAPPLPEEFTQIVKNVGRQSQDARRVEVPFSRIAPRKGELWSLDSRAGIDVPLGRAGAMKLQRMRLGKGTSQHVLIAGKTGSGKSTFLHALITNVALHYSSDEVELFLIDFKKGVEFKTYAVNQLPHARVIAIESDREFGVSALEKLDGVLKERGELFREQGVQDIAGYRNARPDARMPRILLIIDEFQEFFVEDDRISQSATLLLDRLVRQGRAFGIHVLLGSQTLGGAYSLARSTIGQMAVRIALQCSESDAHLILSEDNTAARLLTRPGEAIYNDANGLLEGNNPFQIAWLDDVQRDEHLSEIRDLARQRKVESATPIVFEGNVPSDASHNHELRTLLQAERPAQNPTVPTAWLGEAVAIKGPTEVRFAPQSGANMIIVGQSSDAATGIMAASFVSLSAQFPPTAESNKPVPQLYVFDADPEEHPQWPRLADAVPHRVELVDLPAVADAVNQLATEVQRREASDETSAPPIFAFVVNLARFRDLRKDDDDFSFSSSLDADETPSVSKQFTEILTSGPAVGVHLILWCDSYKNAERWIGRQLMKELEIRVAFQMNPMDSSNFIDTAVAGTLGAHRAILYLDDEGSSEKFRPYGPPEDDWIAQVKAALLGEAIDSTDSDSLETVDLADDLDSWTVM